MKTILIILIVASFAMGQSDSLKLQVSQTCETAITTGKLAIVTTVSTVETVVETGKTAITASKEVYNSKACQKGIKTSKKLLSKFGKFISSQIDSLGK